MSLLKEFLVALFSYGLGMAIVYWIVRDDPPGDRRLVATVFDGPGKRWHKVSVLFLAMLGIVTIVSDVFDLAGVFGSSGEPDVRAYALVASFTALSTFLHPWSKSGDDSTDEPDLTETDTV